MTKVRMIKMVLQPPTSDPTPPLSGHDTVNLNASQVRHFFGANYWPRLAIIESMQSQLSSIGNKIRNIASSLDAQVLNAAANFTTQMFNESLNRMNTINKNLKTKIDDVADDIRSELSSVKNNLQNLIAQNHNAAISHTDSRVNNSDARTDSLLDGLENEINNRFGWIGDARTWIGSGQANVSDFSRAAFEEFFGVDFDEINEFVKNPLSAVLSFLINNVLELILDVASEAFSRENDELPPGKFIN